MVLNAIRTATALLKPTPLDAPTIDELTDPRQWLESVEGASQLDWVRAKNDEVLSVLGKPEDTELYRRILDTLDSKEKIPFVGRVLNGMFYNFWQDETHVQGIWRRCDRETYGLPEPAWETVLDLDALSAKDGVSWVWHGSTILDEGPGVRTERAIIALSRGGSDANEAREMDLDTKEFIPASAGGFYLPEAKSRFSYVDRDTLLVGGDFFGEGSMTDSGYPRTARIWKRGTPLESATEVYAGEQTDVAVSSHSYLEHSYLGAELVPHPCRYTFRTRAITFYTSEHTVKLGPEGFGETAAAKGFVKIAIPEDAEVNTFADQILIDLRSEWRGYKAGSKLAAPAAAFLDAAPDSAEIGKLLFPLFEPTDSCSLDGEGQTLNFVILSVLETVRSELRFWHYTPPSPGGGKGTGGAGRSKGVWELRSTFRDENLASVSASGVDANSTDDIWVTSSGYLQPTTLAIATASSPEKQAQLKALPSRFDASSLKVEQLFATSADGTQIPYFLVSRKDRKADGSTPTLLYGYGGFEISMTPGYAASVGFGWLEKGCAYAVANIRGGGEFGPKWHQAALKANRNKAYEDFEAVAKDLVGRGVTTSDKLGIQGGSNGGLLMGNMLARSPELYGAILCQVPLLDMRRYSKLLAGASWMGEYGNPDLPEEWSFLQQYSPYHTVVEGAAAPPTLFTTSTRDDRVHPGHARKLAGKMVDLHMPVLSYENIEGGHGGAANNKQRAFMSTLGWTFLYKALVEKSIDAPLRQRANTDGGRRRLLNSAVVLKSELRASVAPLLSSPVVRRAASMPAWLLPALGAAGVAVFAVLRGARRLR